MKKILFFIFCFLFIPLFVSAEEVVVDDVIVNPDTSSYPYYFYYHDNQNRLSYAYSDSYFYVSSISANVNYYFKSDDSKITYKNSSSNGRGSFVPMYNVLSDTFYSSFDIKNTNGDILFQKNISSEPVEEHSIEFSKVNFIDSNYLSTFDLTEKDVSNVYDKIDSLGSSCNKFFFYPRDGLYNGSSWGKGIRLVCSNNSTLAFSLSQYSTGSYKINLLLKGEHITDYIYMNDNFYKGSETVQDVTFTDFTSFDDNVFPDSSLNFYYYTNFDSVLFSDLGYYNKLIINEDVYNANEFIKLDDLDYVVPKISYEKISEEKDSLDKIVSQTFKFSWDIFDTTKYDYYFSSDNESWAVTNSKDNTLTFIENGSIYFKVTKKDYTTLYTFSLEVKDINNYLSDDTLNEDNYFMGDLTDNPSPDDIPNENDSTVGGYIQWWFEKIKNLIYDKFGIFSQFTTIYNTYKTYNISGWGETGFIYQFADKKKFFSCDMGVSANNLRELYCFPLSANSLPFLNKSIYLINLGNFNSMINFLHILVYIFLGSFTALKCYRLIISFIDKFKIGGV